MSVERENAVVDNSIILRTTFKYSQTNDFFDPDAISKVEILDSDGVTVLQTIVDPDIIQDATGKYHVVADAIDTPKTIYDKWYFTPAPGADEITKTNTCIVWATVAGAGVTPGLDIGVNSWVTLVEANAYFAGRWGSDEFWNDDLTDVKKSMALITAYNQILNSGYYEIPSTVNDIIKNAQCEQALFLVVHGSDAMRRMGLQNQGVLSAGIVKETYDPLMRGKIPFAAEVMALLNVYAVNTGAHVVELTRDDSKDINGL